MGSTERLMMTAIIFPGLYSGDPKIAKADAFIFLTKSIGHDKLVICMTTWILFSCPVNRLTYNQTGSSRVVVADNSIKSVKMRSNGRKPVIVS